MKDDLKVMRLRDYEAYPFALQTSRLAFDLGEEHTIVSSSLRFARTSADARDLFLDGEEVQLQSVAINGRQLTGNEYAVSDEGLTVFSVPDEFELSIVTKIDPAGNQSGEGLYKSHDMYCTQCEAQGFRRITYFPDRPDVLSEFTTEIVANPNDYPVLLSNGNLVDEEVLEDGRKRVRWHDPHRKPSYLFALVAGSLACRTGSFVTQSGRTVEIRIYTEPRNIQHTEWALDSIYQAMRWDERRYGREYDLDMYMVVAVEHFNMGAMENKGLNIFNTNAVLANADVSTDQGFERVQRVIAHEYFHNWSGNRVTCRDWFQLSLKEGFTVYRDSQFARETNSMATRIDDVAALKERQFPEDAGELAHPVRPSQVSRFNNFYTTTIYEKGAEVVGMMHRLLGDKRYRVGTDLYFSRHDGQAVTTDDFVAALEDASGVDLEQFRLWYTQAGTPRLQINENRSGDRVQLTITQDCPATPSQPVKQPFHIPLALGMFDLEGSDILGETGQENGYRASVDSNAIFENPDGDGTLIFHLRAPVTEISINGVPHTAGTSVLRDFSAPVNVDFDQPIERRVTQAVKDPNQYCRWEAVQSLLKDYIGAKVPSVEPIVEIYDVLTRQALDPSTAPETRSVLASTMEIPTELATLDSYPGLVLEQLIEARTELRHVLSYSFAERWRDLGQVDRVPQPFRPDLESRSARSMRHLAQYFLLPLEDQSNSNEYFEGQRDEIQAADNLTDRLASLERILELTNVEPEARSDVVNGFFERWKHERLVVDHWFRIQSQCRRPDGVSRVRDLMRHPAFDISHANSVRAVLNAFATSNIPNFHHLDSSGYGLIVEQVIAIDEFNQTVAARLLTELSRWKRFDGARQSLMCDALRRVRDHATSEDVRDICERSLSDAD